MRYDLSRLKVLVVDDSVFMTRILGALLDALRIRDVTIARTMQDALAYFATGRYDIIFTDWEMGPGGNGAQLLQEIRKNPESPDPFVTVIAVSAHTDVNRIREMLTTGVDDVLVKPVSAESLYRRLVRAIEQPGQFVRTDGYFGPARNLERVPALAGGFTLQ